jgi:radical SAM superfamily enzyme YgiQ (UPF0313 family)
MKILLVKPNYDSHIITPPLGLGYISSYLQKFGVEALVIDGLREKLKMNEMVERILVQKPDVVGITCMTAFYNEVIALSRALHEKGIKIVIGGPHPTFLPYQTLVDSLADYVICGEGEVAFLNLVEQNLCGDNIQGVYSLSNLKNEEQPIIKAQVINNLDDIPFPDWVSLDPRSYPRAPHGAFMKGFPIGIIITSRGCPYECTFCASPKLCDRKIRFRSPDNVVEEIKYLINNFQIKEIHFEDDNLTLRRDNIEKLCYLLIGNGIKVNWACPNGIRADKVDREIIQLMKDSGCYFFSYGIESANNNILKNIKKRESIEVIEKAIEIADEVGISTQGFFIFGLPGETAGTIEENIVFAVKSKLSRAQFLILDVLPGSELWETLKGKFVPNWNKESYREPEWLPEGVTMEQLQSAQSRAFRRFYLRPKIFWKLARQVDYRQFFYFMKRIKDYRLLKK